MKLAAYCIRHRVTTIMACVMAAIFGALSFSELPLALLPDVELPMVVIYDTYQAGPAEVENLVTKTLEAACASVAGMEELRSVSSENVSVIMVTFADGTNLDNALVDLREKIDQVKAYLPDDAGAPVVMSINMEALPVCQLALTGTDLASLQSVAEDTVSPALERIEGVASVDIQGGFENEIAVETYSEKLEGYGLSLSYIAQILAADNITIPGGSVENGAGTLAVRTNGSYATVEDVANCILPLSTGGTVRLGEVADVYLKPQERTTIAKVNGQDCVLLSVNKQSDVNTVQVAGKVNRALEKLTREHPTLQWQMLMDQRDFISLATDAALVNILLGVALAALVLLVFLRDWGATLVISVAMPLCIVIVFLVMRLLNITMNMMSLGGVAMGVGMIVDNSIVVLENIFRYRSDGFDPLESCTRGTGEVGLSIMASTLTTVAVFLPIGLSEGIVGMMVGDFCLTICTLLGASLLVALTIVPLLSYGLLRRSTAAAAAAAMGDRENRKEPVSRRLAGWYRRCLAFFIRRRAFATFLTFALLCVFAAGVFLDGFEMIPEMDQGTVAVTLSLPVGSETAEAELLADRAAAIIEETVPELDSIYYSTGGGTLSSLTGGNGTSINLNLVPADQRQRSAQQIASRLRLDLGDLAGAEVSVSSAGMMDMSALTGDAISVTVSGNDDDLLEETASRLQQAIAALPDATGVTSSAGDQIPQVDITIRRETATSLGLTAATIGTAVRSQLTGSTATILRVGGEQINVVVRGEGDAGKSLDALRSMPVTTPLGSSVPLGMVADVDVVMAPRTVVRQNQSHTITITGDSLADDSTGIAASVQALLADFYVPEGITIEQEGENEAMVEAFTSLGKALVVALGLVYFVLASQFESFLMPVIIMLILPVSLVGSVAPLWLFGMRISIISLVGVIMLSGTVVNSSIVLVDYIKIRRQRGEEKNEAILNACPRRVRPVLMTTLTTILGLMPMAVGYGDGAELMQPMAIVMISGMVISTIVTLFVTPVYYSLLDSAGARVMHLPPMPEEPEDEGPSER